MRKKNPLTPENALIRLQTLCARSERCRHELAEKLRTWGVGFNDSERILQSLENQRFFDDLRFARSFSRDKVVYGKWGKRKITLALRAKRINQSDINEAFDEIDEEEYLASLHSVMRGKARSLKEGNTFEGRTKLFRFGVARGFEPSLVADFIKSGKVWGEEDEELEDED